MSNIYGNQIIPNDVSSLYFFDKTYDSDELSNESLRKSYAEGDGVLIGRYALSRKAGVKGKSLTINKMFRKVATSEGVDYEQVAILDAVTPTFHTNTVNIKEELFDVKNHTFEGYVPKSTSSTDNTISISATGPRDYTKVGAPIEHDVEINLPVLGETVASMNNLMYGQTNRTQTVQGANTLVSNIKVGGRTLEADGVIGVLGSLDWKALSNASKTAWALNYLNITEDPGSKKISDDFLPLVGGEMANAAAIKWAGTDVSLAGAGTKDSESGSSLFLNAGGEYIRLSKNDGVNMLNVTVGRLKVGSSPETDQDAVRYTEVKRLVSQGGMPYILSSSDITNGTAPGDNMIYVSDQYSNLPANTIFFVKAEN